MSVFAEFHAPADAFAPYVTLQTVPETVVEIERELHHVHLPQLDDAGLVSYDVEATTAAYVGHDEVDAGLLLAD